MQKGCKHIYVFYDGHCGLCHRFVKFVLPKLDETSALIFSSQQGKLFECFLAQGKVLRANSIVVYDEDKQRCYFKAEAIIYILSLLKKGKKLAFFLKLLPRFLVNGGYLLLASHRRRLFKTPDELCPLVPKKYKKYFQE